MQTTSTRLLILLLLLGTASCRHVLDYFDEAEPRPLAVSDFASGLNTPIGLAVDTKGRVWVAEAGTGKDDSRISLITPAGKVYSAIEGFRSVIFDGSPAGVTHILLEEGTLWILQSAEGKLYRADVSDFEPGDPPIQVSSLLSEDISTFVKAYKFENDTEESNLYNLTFGPDGALYIADAAANAIIRRDKSGKLSVFATVPGVENPTQVGPPVLQPVPTGIVFDGHKFLVTTFLGFPFPPHQAVVYQFDLEGNVSVYQRGFSSLIDIELGPDGRPVVLEFGQWDGQAFAPASGSAIRATGTKKLTLAAGLKLPTDIVRSGLKTYYVASMAEGKVLRVTYHSASL
jgi:sugar lactone lactonase YvrE